MSIRSIWTRALAAVVLIGSVVLVTAAPASAATSPSDQATDACALLKARNVKSALRDEPKALRPIAVYAAVAPSSTGDSDTRSCALGVLLPKKVGGSVQVFASPARKGVCPPKPVTKAGRAKVDGRPVVLIRSGKRHQVRGVVFAKKGTCVSVAAVLSNGRAVSRAAYLALAGTALHRL